MTNGTIGALLCRDLIFDYDNPYAKIYDPSRQMTRNPFGYIKHNLEASTALFDYVTGGSCPSDIEDLQCGQVNKMNNLYFDFLSLSLRVVFNEKVYTN